MRYSYVGKIRFKVFIIWEEIPLDFTDCWLESWFDAIDMAMSSFLLLILALFRIPNLLSIFVLESFISWNSPGILVE